MNLSDSVDIIGLKESIDLPEYGISSVPAKIDTGADFSSIWASNISFINDELSFSLFGPGNAFYTGQKIVTKKFQAIKIKNSFGVAESRYKIKLMIGIGDRKISGTFTLADRSGMSYPVLIGRKLLKGKFVVDVSQMEVHSPKGNKKDILVLVSGPSKALKEFISDITENLKTDKTKFAIRSYKDLEFCFDETGVKVTETITNKDIASFDLVYFKSHKNDQIRAAAAAKYLQARNVKFFDKELLSYLSHDKLTQYVQLALYGVPVPATISGSSEYLAGNSADFAKKWGWPLVYKEATADRGRKNYLVRDQKELEAQIKKAKPGEIYLLQRFVPNDGYLRIFVFGNEPSVAVSRKPHEHANPKKRHLNNPQGSVNAKLLNTDTELSPKLKDLAVKAAKAMNRQVAGIDLIQDKKNYSWYILEVNNGPQLRTGSFIAEKQRGLAKFIDQQLNR